MLEMVPSIVLRAYPSLAVEVVANEKDGISMQRFGSLIQGVGRSDPIVVDFMVSSDSDILLKAKS